jgi:4-hydroxybenzoate polyprenyltransferase
LSHNLIRALYFLFPRPLDFALKSILFFHGVLVSIIFSSASTLQPGNSLIFIEGFSIPPANQKLITISLWFFIQEVLIQQAKYVWNDLHDRKKDQSKIGKNDRAVARGFIGKKSAVLHIIIRILIGLVLGSMLDLRLYWLLVWILMHQIVYEYLLKFQGRTLPILVLVYVALGSFTRVMGGVLAAGGNLWNSSILVILMAFLFFSIGTIATFWRIEGEHDLKVHQNTQTPLSFQRSASEYFIKHGREFQYFGFSGFFVSSLLLSLNQTNLLQELFLNQLTETPLTLILSVNLILLITVTLLALFIYKYFRQFLVWVAKKNRIRYLYASIFIIVIIANNFFHLDPKLIYSSCFILYSIISSSTYENMDYDKFMLVPTRKNN